MRYHARVTVLVLLYVTLQCHTKILRNNALMTKMISHFQQDNNLSTEPQRKEKRRIDFNPRDEAREQKQDEDIETNKENPHIHRPEKILSLMQNVLCRNFPSIPCNIIMQDQALNQLIQRSIQQITHKKLQMDQTTPVLSRSDSKSQTLYPIINSEDLSNFLEVSNTGYFDETGQKVKLKKKKVGSEVKVKNHWSHEKPSKKKLKGSKDTKHGTELFSGRKKMRKFYPHKIKYKDKNSNDGRVDFTRDYDTNEKMSMSAELPDMPLGIPQQNREHLAYKVEASDSPVWRIDYMKHGDPSVPRLNVFGFADNQLTGKLMKASAHTQAIIADENGLEQSVRKDVLHPDVYIKKNFVRRNTNSEVMD